MRNINYKIISDILNVINSLEILESKKVLYFTTDKSELKSIDYDGSDIKTITSFNFPDSRILAIDPDEKFLPLIYVLMSLQNHNKDSKAFSHDN